MWFAKLISIAQICIGLTGLRQRIPANPYLKTFWQTYKNDIANMKWSTDFKEMIKYNKDRISRFNFNEATADFLTNYGLPKEAAPFLTFSNDTDEQYEGIGKLTHKFDFFEKKYKIHSDWFKWKR